MARTSLAVATKLVSIAQKLARRSVKLYSSFELAMSKLPRGTCTGINERVDFDRVFLQSLVVARYPETAAQRASSDRDIGVGRCPENSTAPLLP